MAFSLASAPPLVKKNASMSPGVISTDREEYHITFTPDGRFVTLLKSRPEDKDRYDLWAIDTATGNQRMLVDSQKIGSGAAVSEEEKMRRERARIAGTSRSMYLASTSTSRFTAVPVVAAPYGEGLRKLTRALHWR